MSSQMIMDKYYQLTEEIIQIKNAIYGAGFQLKKIGSGYILVKG